MNSGKYQNAFFIGHLRSGNMQRLIKKKVPLIKYPKPKWMLKKSTFLLEKKLLDPQQKSVDPAKLFDKAIKRVHVSKFPTLLQHLAITDTPLPETLWDRLTLLIAQRATQLTFPELSHAILVLCKKNQITNNSNIHKILQIYSYKIDRPQDLHLPALVHTLPLLLDKALTIKLHDDVLAQLQNAAVRAACDAIVTHIALAEHGHNDAHQHLLTSEDLLSLCATMSALEHHLRTGNTLPFFEGVATLVHGAPVPFSNTLPEPQIHIDSQALKANSPFYVKNMTPLTLIETANVLAKFTQISDTPLPPQASSSSSTDSPTAHHLRAVVNLTLDKVVKDGLLPRLAMVKKLPSQLRSKSPLSSLPEPVLPLIEHTNKHDTLTVAPRARLDSAMRRLLFESIHTDNNEDKEEGGKNAIISPLARTNLPYLLEPDTSVRKSEYLPLFPDRAIRDALRFAEAYANLFSQGELRSQLEAKRLAPENFYQNYSNHAGASGRPAAIWRLPLDRARTTLMALRALQLSHVVREACIDHGGLRYAAAGNYSASEGRTKFIQTTSGGLKPHRDETRAKEYVLLLAQVIMDRKHEMSQGTLASCFRGMSTLYVKNLLHGADARDFAQKTLGDVMGSVMRMELDVRETVDAMVGIARFYDVIALTPEQAHDLERHRDEQRKQWQDDKTKTPIQKLIQKQQQQLETDEPTLVISYHPPIDFVLPLSRSLCVIFSSVMTTEQQLVALLRAMGRLYTRETLSPEVLESLAHYLSRHVCAISVIKLIFDTLRAMRIDLIAQDRLSNALFKQLRSVSDPDDLKIAKQIVRSCAAALRDAGNSSDGVEVDFVKNSLKLIERIALHDQEGEISSKQELGFLNDVSYIYYNYRTSAYKQSQSAAPVIELPGFARDHNNDKARQKALLPLLSTSEETMAIDSQSAGSLLLIPVDDERTEVSRLCDDIISRSDLSSWQNLVDAESKFRLSLLFNWPCDALVSLDYGPLTTDTVKRTDYCARWHDRVSEFERYIDVKSVKKSYMRYMKKTFNNNNNKPPPTPPCTTQGHNNNNNNNKPAAAACGHVYTFKKHQAGLLPLRAFPGISWVMPEPSSEMDHQVKKAQDERKNKTKRPHKNKTYHIRAPPILKEKNNTHIPQKNCPIRAYLSHRLHSSSNPDSPILSRLRSLLYDYEP